MDNLQFQMAPLTPMAEPTREGETLFIPKGVCAKAIHYVVKDGMLADLNFTGGCDGNLKAMSILLKDMPVKTVIAKLEGLTCGNKSTSCADQLCIALREHMAGTRHD